MIAKPFMTVSIKAFLLLARTPAIDLVARGRTNILQGRVGEEVDFPRMAKAMGRAKWSHRVGEGPSKNLVMNASTRTSIDSELEKLLCALSVETQIHWSIFSSYAAGGIRSI